MTKLAVHFSSESDEWETPQFLFDAIHQEFRPELDVCATKENAKCRRYFDKAVNGLSQDWVGVCWMNPPYGRAIGKWMKKAFESSTLGATVVCLVPARTDTAWWHKYASRGEVRYLRGRLKFGSATKSAPFPSAIIIFHAPRCWQHSLAQPARLTQFPRNARQHNVRP